MPHKQPHTPLEFIDWAERRFRKGDLYYGHGTDNPGDEAAYLVLGALNLPFTGGSAALNRPLPEDKREWLAGLVERRIAERIPVAYLINRAWFAGIPFYVDERVLIPRSPIAELIEERFEPWLDEARVKRILDIGTGCGGIAIACAMAFPDANVDAADISPDALDVARENVARHNLEGRVRCVQSDLFAGLSRERYDLIVGNLPYLTTTACATFPPEYQYEPRLGFEGGRDGLDLVRRLLREAPAHLTADGLLVAEVGTGWRRLAENYPNTPFTWLDFERGGEGVFLLRPDELPGTREPAELQGTS
ncbi:MAG: 50S ribosomal protein L3 N(5)-glutamine methyltransferase [Gammaproteobacteria bacterium]|nr:50S ribosomal protein L3 N(5)-glutamine methyltransferase [Gammaproteobacteria bacterium]